MWKEPTALLTERRGNGDSKMSGHTFEIASEFSHRHPSQF